MNKDCLALLEELSEILDEFDFFDNAYDILHDLDEWIEEKREEYLEDD